MNYKHAIGITFLEIGRHYILLFFKTVIQLLLLIKSADFYIHNKNIPIKYNNTCFVVTNELPEWAIIQVL